MTQKKEFLMDTHYARALGKPEDVSLEDWCKEKGYKPHPLCIVAEQVTKEVLGTIKNSN